MFAPEGKMKKMKSLNVFEAWVITVLVIYNSVREVLILKQIIHLCSLIISPVMHRWIKKTDAEISS